MESFTDLEAWKTGVQLVRKIYKITKTFPEAERFGLTSQLRRAATSILANLAEGFGRSTAADKYHKYIIARGECTETHALLLISMELKFLSKELSDTAIALSLHTGKLLSGLAKKYSDVTAKPRPYP